MRECPTLIPQHTVNYLETLVVVAITTIMEMYLGAKCNSRLTDISSLNLGKMLLLLTRLMALCPFCLYSSFPTELMSTSCVC